jgi:hypothetical protein
MNQDNVYIEKGILLAVKDIKMKTASLLFCLILIVSTLAGIALAVDPPSIQAWIYYDTKPQWLALQRMGLDLIGQKDGAIEIITNQAELDKIIGSGYKAEIIHDDLEAFYRSRLPNKHMGNYKTLAEIYAHIDSVIAAHPDIVSPKLSIGQTLEGRDIWAIKISDNPETDEDEPEVLYTACIHAREVITPEILLNFMDYLTQNYGVDPEVTDLVNNRELWLVPMVNPDGYHYNEVTSPYGGGMWRKNRRYNGDGSYGIDLNRNFGYMWGYDDAGSSPTPSSETYRGTGPFSELETQALRDFSIERNFTASLYFHSAAHLILWPWGYDILTTPDNDIFASMGDSITAMNGYTPGPIWTLYVVNGGSDDWYYGEQTFKSKGFGITIEAGTDQDGFWPQADRIEPIVAENLGPCLFLARIAGHIYDLRPPAAPVLSVADTVSAGAYTVHWTHTDTLNPASLFELTELQDFRVITDSANSYANWDNAGFLSTTYRYASAPYSFYSGMSVNNVNIHFQSKESYLVQPGDTLRFKTFYKIETNWDYAYVEISTDGITFTPIPGSITTNYNPNGSNRGNGITGTSVGGWIDAIFDLSAYTGQEVFLRFTYITDQYTTEEGIYIDDIRPVGMFAVQNLIFPVMDTLYAFSEKPQGLYSYKVRARDAQRQWSLFSNREMTFVESPYICGDASGDQKVTVADAVYIISYIFRGGPAPDPLMLGDANGNGVINAADAVYLVSYIFRGGPAPVCL